MATAKPEGGQRRRYAKRLAPTDRKHALLDAARALVFERGFAEVSIAAVAERGGVTRPVVYDSFASRDELLYELIDRERARMLAVVERSLLGVESSTQATDTVPQADTAARLSGGLARFLDEVRAEPGSWRLVYFPIDGVPSMLRDQVERAREEVRAPLSSLLGEWLSSKRHAEQVDLDVLAHLVHGIVDAAARLVLDAPDLFDNDRIVTMFDEFLLRPP
ncbi:TetR/AcrR family transcriptional regulator [Nocardia altamirensis]|uniref:TetR/AcrR family transcriptional regulator n=1 Tax=Nocardia altamirensis TaxID=472158 RepID=UPI0008401C79|nr:TetR/AcrR family transcriptional regulator [Nocardia altamirensis]